MPVSAPTFRRVVDAALLVMIVASMRVCFHDPYVWPEKREWLHGTRIETVVADLGAPQSLIEFTMDHFCIGHNESLYNTYPPHYPHAADVRIKEYRWILNRHHIAVWMHQVNGEWLVFDTLRWPEDTVF